MGAAGIQPESLASFGRKPVTRGKQAVGSGLQPIVTDAMMKGFQDGGAGLKTWERVWQNPLFEEYADSLKSFAADFKHTGGKGGGACVAAVILNKIITYPCIHLDYAGPVSIQPEKPYTPKWATGLGARTLTQFLRDWVEK